MASTLVDVLSTPALSALIGALAGLGGGFIAAYFQRKDRQEAERERRRKAAAKAVGPVLSLILEGRLDRAGPGPGDLSGHLGAWQAAWSTYREPLLVMSVSHPSKNVYDLGRFAADAVLEWLDGVRRYVIEALQLSEKRRKATYQEVYDETQDHDEATLRANEAAVIDLHDQELSNRQVKLNGH
jgi:hypothetical protein